MCQKQVHLFTLSQKKVNIKTVKNARHERCFWPMRNLKTFFFLRLNSSSINSSINSSKHAASKILTGNSFEFLYGSYIRECFDCFRDPAHYYTVLLVYVNSINSYVRRAW